ncbi:hypothetical protein K2Z84_26010, partial [Candidatus Binatia bacterium]|nr:hypothetical protein [Candidatus Binatia bacterium]
MSDAGDLAPRAARANVVSSDAYDRAAIVRLRRASHAWRALDADGAKLVPHFAALVEDLFCALFKLNVVLKPESEVAVRAAFSRRVLSGVLQGPAYEMLRLHTPLDEARAGLGAVLIGEAVLRALREDRVLTSGDLLDLWNLEREEDAAREAEEEAEVGRELAEEARRRTRPRPAGEPNADGDAGASRSDDDPAVDPADESAAGDAAEPSPGEPSAEAPSRPA